MLDNQQFLCGDEGVNIVYNRIGIGKDWNLNRRDYGLGATQEIGSWIWRLRGDLVKYGFRNLTVAKAQQIMLITLFEILVNLNEYAKQDTLHKSLEDHEYQDVLRALQGEVDFMHEHVAIMLPILNSNDRGELSEQYKMLRNRYAYYISGHRPDDWTRVNEITAVNRYCGKRIGYDGSFMYHYAKMVDIHTQFGNYESYWNRIKHGLAYDARQSIYDTQSGRRTLEICRLIEAVKTDGYGADLYANALLQAICERQQSYSKIMQKESH